MHYWKCEGKMRIMNGCNYFCFRSVILKHLLVLPALSEDNIWSMQNTIIKDEKRIRSWGRQVEVTKIPLPASNPLTSQNPVALKNWSVKVQEKESVKWVQSLSIGSPSLQNFMFCLSCLRAGKVFDLGSNHFYIRDGFLITNSGL